VSNLFAHDFDIDTTTRVTSRSIANGIDDRDVVVVDVVVVVITLTG
jgi:hypothetical protein